MREDEPGDRSRAEDLVWRDIVDHYGASPDADELTELTPPLERPEAGPAPAPEDDPFRLDLDDETFMPPPLPPPAVISPERRVAWAGLVASPILLVLINLFDYSLPGILEVGLVIAFIASFGYLVATMAPRDPDDDGARL
jgi:hypothetical protein